MGTFQSFRKAYGALKDSTTVGVAKVNSEFKDVDIAVVKATNHVEAPPKERHVRKIFGATSVVRPRGDVSYCIHALARRLEKTRNWIVVVKVLIVIHRTLREGDPTFREELLVCSHKGHILQISSFKDDSSSEAWDCSSWVRMYALYIEERLECYRVLKYDIEAERLTRSSPGASKVHSRTRVLTGDELLEQLPALQQLLYRLMACQPEGGACTNYLIQYALALVLKESFKIYCAINDGIINLVDMFFDMPKLDAVKALDIYKRAGQQAEYLADFYEFCKRLDLARSFQFPTLRQPPPSFLATMEEYVKEAPPYGSVTKQSDYQEKEESPSEEEKPEESREKTEKEAEEEKPKDEQQEEAPQPPPGPRPESPPLISTDDLVGLNEVNPEAAELEDRNALALAILPPGGQNQSSTTDPLGELGTSGWELALVTKPSSNNTTPQQGGSFDKLFLDSLYEDDNARRQLQMQNAGYAPPHGMGAGPFNPFEQQQDPFFMSGAAWVPPPTDVQMAMPMLPQQQHQQQQMMMMMMQQQSPSMMVPCQNPPSPQIQFPQQQQQQPMGMGTGTATSMGMGAGMGPSNPFGNPFSGHPQNTTTQQGNPGLL